MFRIVICDNSKTALNECVGLTNRILKEITSKNDAGVLTVTPKDLYGKTIDDIHTYFFILDVIYQNVDFTGIELGKKLRSQYKKMFIAFCTRHIEFMSLVINENIMPSGFISKPANKPDLERVIRNVYRDFVGGCANDLRTISVNTGSAVYRIPYRQIVYFEATEKKIFITTVNQRISYYNSLASLETELGDGFMRCHKSFIVNLQRISTVIYNDMLIIMDNKAAIPMSRTYKANIKAHMERNGALQL